MRNFHKLDVWRKSYDLALAVYKITRTFPGEERYEMTNQLRRAATSIPANIAEGCGRFSDADFVRFLHIALGSANEVECFLLLSRDLDYLSTSVHADLNDQVIEVKKMLAALIRRNRQREADRREQQAEPDGSNGANDSHLNLTTDTASARMIFQATPLSH